MAKRLARQTRLALPNYISTGIFKSASYSHRNLTSTKLLKSLHDETEENRQIQNRRPRPNIKNMEEVKRVQPKQYELAFEDYIKLKSSLKTRKNIAGLPFAILGMGTSSVISAYMFPEMFDATPENVQLIMGLDPLVFCGICGVISAGVGFAAGTQLFRFSWGILNKRKAEMLVQREKDFLERIQSKRFASFSKFEDDYYGESIKNLSDYRQWLRTQQKKANIDEKYTSKKKNDNTHEIRTV